MNRNYRIAVALFLISTWPVGCSDGQGVASLIDAERRNSFELFTAASAALAAGRIEDAGFLFFAAQARFEIDMQVFPPTQSGADSPKVLKSALSATIGQAIQPALATKPVAYANIAG